MILSRFGVVSIRTIHEFWGGFPKTESGAQTYKSSDETNFISAGNWLVWFCSFMACSDLTVEALIYVVFLDEN